MVFLLFHIDFIYLIFFFFGSSHVGRLVHTRFMGMMHLLVAHLRENTEATKYQK